MIRRASTLLETIVAVAILAGLLVVVNQALLTGQRSGQAMTLRSEVVGTANRTVHELAMDLRYATGKPTRVVDTADEKRWRWNVNQRDEATGAVVPRIRELVYAREAGRIWYDEEPAQRGNGFALWWRTLDQDGVTEIDGRRDLVPEGLAIHDRRQSGADQPDDPTDLDGDGDPGNDGFVLEEDTAVTDASEVRIALCVRRAVQEDDEQYLQWTAIQERVSLRQPSWSGKALVVKTGDAADAPPSITSPADVTWARGRSAGYSITVEGTATAFGVFGELPPGISFSRSQGYLLGTPAEEGYWRVVVSASNEAGTSMSPVDITVVEDGEGELTGSAPTVHDADVEATVGAAFSHQVAADHMRQVDVPLGWSAGGLPPGLSLDSVTGRISGTPTAAVTEAVKVTARNAFGEDTGEVRIVVKLPPPAPPTVTSAEVNAVAGRAFTWSITASRMGAADGPVGYGAQNLPADLTIDEKTGVISGIPAAAGDHAVVIGAENAAGIGTGLLTLHVADAATLPLPEVYADSFAAAWGESTVIALSATNVGAEHAPVAWSSSALPAGLALDAATGQITGVPTVDGVNASVAVSVSNKHGSGSNTIAIAIPARTKSVPVVTAGSINKPVGSTGLSHQIAATSMSPVNLWGYGAPLKVTYGASGLPPGWTCDAATGLVSGDGDTVGTWSASITATNRDGTGSAALAITINDPDVPVVGKGSLSLVQGTDMGAYQISATNMTSKYKPVGYAAQGLPSGLSCDSSGRITGTPSVNGTFSVVISAQNKAGTGSETLTVVVALPAKPTVGAVNGQISRGVPYSLQVPLTNMGSAYQPQGCSATGLPGGLAVDAQGRISGTTTAQTGTYTVTVTATNVAGAGSGTATLVVKEPEVHIAYAAQASVKKTGGSVDVAGSYVTATPPSGYTIAVADVTVSVTGGITATKQAFGSGVKVVLSGKVSASNTITATVTATAKPSGGTVGAAVTETSSTYSFKP